MNRDPADIFEQRLRALSPAAPSDALRHRILDAARQEAPARAVFGWTVRAAAAIIVACLCLNAWIDSGATGPSRPSRVVAEPSLPDPRLQEFAVSLGCRLPGGQARPRDGITVRQAQDQLEALLKS